MGIPDKKPQIEIWGQLGGKITNGEVYVKKALAYIFVIIATLCIADNRFSVIVGALLIFVSLIFDMKITYSGDKQRRPIAHIFYYVYLLSAFIAGLQLITTGKDRLLVQSSNLVEKIIIGLLVFASPCIEFWCVDSVHSDEPGKADEAEEDKNTNQAVGAEGE